MAASWSRSFLQALLIQLKLLVSFLNFRSLSFRDGQVHDRDHNHGYVSNMSVTQCISHESFIWNCPNLHKLECSIDEILTAMMEVCTKKLKSFFFSTFVHANQSIVIKLCKWQLLDHGLSLAFPVVNELKYLSAFWISGHFHSMTVKFMIVIIIMVMSRICLSHNA